MRAETTEAGEVITVDHDSSERRKAPETVGLGFIDDATLLSELAAIREARQDGRKRSAELATVHDALMVELDQRAVRVWKKNYAPPEDSERVDRAPADMSTWELIATYRHAWALSHYRPRGYLAKALANWLLSSRRELESRGAWAPEIMPPYNM